MEQRIEKLERQCRWYRNLFVLAGLVIVALLAHGCAATGSVCQTAYGKCSADSAGKPGHTCVCRYQFWSHPGLLR